ncbi:hypothetical protein IWQ60_004403 [Tieghemiomyces parasiticus]|uniref:BZIP domain-containing protein n=1 Tax=Tieghemiomyces parasiticus TaxID=78921 RepID=A0A9W8ABG6_9FUNG|nr:hypothetical protein IWQ60_004403 [Tieghemiomyces parasiticus]
MAHTDFHPLDSTRLSSPPSVDDALTASSFASPLTHDLDEPVLWQTLAEMTCDSEPPSRDPSAFLWPGIAPDTDLAALSNQALWDLQAGGPLSASSAALTDRMANSWLEKFLDLNQLDTTVTSMAASAPPQELTPVNCHLSPLPMDVANNLTVAPLPQPLAGEAASSPSPKKRGRKKKTPVDPNAPRPAPIPLRPLPATESRTTPTLAPPTVCLASASPSPVIKTEPVDDAALPLAFATPAPETPTHVKEETGEDPAQAARRKRQERLIKNRAAALLSRQRKRDHVTTLETHAEDLAKENVALKKREAELETRIAQLTRERDTWEAKFHQLEEASRNSAPAATAPPPPALSVTPPSLPLAVGRSGAETETTAHPRPKPLSTMLMLAFVSFTLFSMPYKQVMGPTPTASSAGPPPPPFESVLQGLDLLPYSGTTFADTAAGSPPPSPRLPSAASQLRDVGREGSERLESRPAKLSASSDPPASVGSPLPTAASATAESKPSLRSVCQWMARGLHRLTSNPRPGGATGTNTPWAGPPPASPLYSAPIGRTDDPDTPLLAGTLPPSVREILEKAIRTCQLSWDGGDHADLDTLDSPPDTADWDADLAHSPATDATAASPAHKRAFVAMDLDGYDDNDDGRLTMPPPGKRIRTLPKFDRDLVDAAPHMVGEPDRAVATADYQPLADQLQAFAWEMATAVQELAQTDQTKV